MINFPSLETLRVCCPMVGDPARVGGRHITSLIVDFDESQPVHLIESPNLTEATIQTPLVPIELNQLIGHLPRVKSLILSGLTLKSLAYDGLPLMLPTSLQYLEHLELHFVEIYSPMQLSCAFCLIRSSPNLQSLLISETVEREAEAEELEDIDILLAGQIRAGTMSKIQSVTFLDLTGVIEEVDFVTTIVTCCPELKSVKAIQDPNVPPQFFAWFLKELRKLHGSLINEHEPDN